jgi:hypothetical protein
VFVDGKAIRDGSQTIDLQPGSYEVSVYNYGYIPNTQQVHIDSKKATDISVALQASGDKVSGPFGDIEFKGHPRAAVLLNGTTPDYFVGHGDEFDWNWIWHQRLLVRPGKYQVTVTREANSIWSGPVDFKAGQQITVYLDQNGRMKTKDWPQGNTVSPQPRFHSGVASAIVPIAPVTAQLIVRSTSSLSERCLYQWLAHRLVARREVPLPGSGIERSNPFQLDSAPDRRRQDRRPQDLPTARRLPHDG